jgi:hypothetical protein
MRAIIPFLAICLMGLVFQPACKTSDEAEENQFTLTVILGEGVSGDPVSGTFTYDQGDVVNYSFTLGAGYGSLTVTLDGTDVPASGTVTMNTDHVLSARAGGCAIDIRGRWKGDMVEYYNNGQNIYDFFFNAEFFGDLAAGSLEGNLDLFPFREEGAYVVEGCDVHLNIGVQWFYMSWVSNIARGILIFRGTAESPNRISGTWEMKTLFFIYYRQWINGEYVYTLFEAPGRSGTFWLERE